MDNFADILKATSHRQYPLPEKPWKQYQEWHGNLFMHWKVQAISLTAFLPKNLTIDTFDDQAWVLKVLRQHSEKYIGPGWILKGCLQDITEKPF